MNKALLTCALLFFFANTSSAQDIKIDSLGFETFSITEGDTTYIMKKYFMVFLNKGTNTNQTPEETASIQQGHMDHINKMAEANQLSIAGPFGDDGDTRGIFILNVPTLDQAKKLVSQDPAVIAGRLIMEVRPWWAAQGSTLK